MKIIAEYPHYEDGDELPHGHTIIRNTLTDERRTCERNQVADTLFWLNSMYDQAPWIDEATHA